MTDIEAPSIAAPFKLARVSRARTIKRDRRPRWSEYLSQVAFVAALILTLSGPWMAGQVDPTLSELRQAGYLGIFLAALVSIRPWRHPQHLLVVPWPLLLALGWCWLSLTWALFPAAGLRRLVLSSIVLWSIFALVREIGHQRIILILRVLLAALLVLNYVAVLAFPDLGIDPDVYEGITDTWRGVMDQKNFVGFACAVTILLFAFNVGFPLIQTREGRTMLGVRLLVIAASGIFLVQSVSKTSLGIGIFALVVGGLLTLALRNRGEGELAPPGWAWLPFAVVTAVFLNMAFDPAIYLEMTSDPGGFTGRTQIWTGLIKAYADQPLLGVGYGSLWDVGDDGPMKVYAKGFAAEVSQGHNGYLDLLVQVGAIGTLIILFAAMVWPIQRILRGGDPGVRVLSAALLLFCLGHNFTESSLMDRDQLGQVFLIIAIALLWQTSAAAPLRART